MILSISALTVPVSLFASGTLRQPFKSRHRCKGN